MRTLRTPRGNYQATAELVISFVGVVALFLGVSQIALIGHRNVVNGQLARERAEEAIRGVGAPLRNPVQGWKDGGDGLNHTADDTAVEAGGGTAEFAESLEKPVRLQDYEAYAAQGQGTAITPLAASNSTATAADLKEGEARDSVPLDPAIRHLLTGAKEISLQDKAYMPGIMLRDMAPPQPQPSP